MEKVSTEKQILNYLQRGYRISALDAFQMFGTMRLAAYIHFLRRKGHDIETITREIGDKQIAYYFLHPQIKKS